MNTPTKSCERCYQEYPKQSTTSRLRWSKQKYCSWDCRAKAVGDRNRGRKDTDEMRMRKSIALSGKNHPNYGKIPKNAAARIAGSKRYCGERHHGWKGDAASGRSIHRWINRHFPKKGKCERCFNETKSTHYANLNGHKYSHKREHFIELCVSCHNIQDGRVKDKATGRYLSVAGAG